MQFLPVVNTSLQAYFLCVSHAFEMDAAFYYFCYFQSIFIGQLIHLLEKKTVNAALSITLSLIPFQMIVLLQCHNRKKMILFHTSRQRHQNRLSEKYCPFMNDNSESFEISTKHFTQQPQNMQLFWLPCSCLPNNSKHTQKQRKESIVQSFIFLQQFCALRS